MPFPSAQIWLQDPGSNVSLWRAGLCAPSVTSQCKHRPRRLVLLCSNCHSCGYGPISLTLSWPTAERLKFRICFGRFLDCLTQGHKKSVNLDHGRPVTYTDKIINVIDKQVIAFNRVTTRAGLFPLALTINEQRLTFVSFIVGKLAADSPKRSNCVLIIYWVISVL
jgi:hypothetical protein